MVDLDKGGTERQWIRVNLGPTIGWVLIQLSNILEVITGGTKNVVYGTTLITVNFNGAVTIQLPSSIPNSAIPSTLQGLPLTIVDIGGFAAANPITILPFAGQTIMGLASIQIANDYGSFSLVPIETGGWAQQ